MFCIVLEDFAFIGGTYHKVLGPFKSVNHAIEWGTLHLGKDAVCGIEPYFDITDWKPLVIEHEGE